MTRTDLEKIMSDNAILDCDIEDSINFVRDLLEFYAEEFRVNEPYATVTIQSIKDAAREVSFVLDYIEEFIRY